MLLYTVDYRYLGSHAVSFPILSVRSCVTVLSDKGGHSARRCIGFFRKMFLETSVPEKCGPFACASWVTVAWWQRSRQLNLNCRRQALALKSKEIGNEQETSTHWIGPWFGSVCSVCDLVTTLGFAVRVPREGSGTQPPVQVLRGP